MSLQDCQEPSFVFFGAPLGNISRQIMYLLPASTFPDNTPRASVNAFPTAAFSEEVRYCAEAAPWTQMNINFITRKFYVVALLTTRPMHVKEPLKILINL